MHVRVTNNESNTWLLSMIYASPRENERDDTWRKILNLNTSINESWLLVGDFNAIASPDEQKGGVALDLQ